MLRRILLLASALSTLPIYVIRAQGIREVNATQEILPSTYYSSMDWQAVTYIANPGTASTWGKYSNVQGTPPVDTQGRQWHEREYTPTGGTYQWEVTKAPYYTEGTYNNLPCTVWGSSSTTSDIYIRRSFTLDKINCSRVYMAVGHDDGESQFYINGTLVHETGKDWNESEYILLNAEQVALLHTDGRENVIALHVHNNYGGGYADCGLYGAPYEDKELGSLPMGFVENWTARLLFNPEGGYNGQYNNVESETHGWERLYEAKSGDVYTISLPTAALTAENARVQFRTPISLLPGHKYQVRVVLTADHDVPGVQFALNQSDNDDVCLAKATCDLAAGQDESIVMSNLTGTDINSAKLEFRFPTKADSTTITISRIRILDQKDRHDLWNGTSYFNWLYYANPATGQRIKDMAIGGRNETMSWTMPDYDASSWPSASMPIGNLDYMPEVRTEWPGGDNTNLWIRREFTIKEVNPRSKYTLRVCHDDSYRIYVNGHLLDAATGWTAGKEYVSIPIPCNLLREGSNVIAAYIQQNWGGRFFDCGMAVEKDFYEESDADADPTQLVINEVQARNIDQYIDWSFNYGGWIEVYNPTEKRVPLAGVWLSVDTNNPRQFQLTQEAGVIPPKGWKALFFDHYKDDGTYGPTANRQVRLKLSNDGGTVLLSSQDGTPISSVTYPQPTARCSYARTTDGGGTWSTTGEPTPSASNNISRFASQRASTPAPSVDSQIFTVPFSMHVPIPEGCTLHYTSDGSTPTATHGFVSKSGEFTISSTLVLRFVLIGKDFLPSEVVTRSYIFRDRDYYLPVLSVTTAPDNLYGDSIGVYVDGVNGESGRNHGKSNRNMDWERPVNVELISPDGQPKLNQEAEFKVSGGWSRHFMPASFKIKASKTYENRKSLDAVLFPHKPFNRYKQILVRNGGNDNEAPQGGRVTDAITQQMILSSQYMVDVQDLQPVHVFFNGKYIGLLNMREPSNRYHGTANYGYDDDQMDAFEYSNGYVQTSGTRDAFDALLALSAQAESPTSYAKLCQMLDIDEYTNYWAAVAYIGPDDWILNHNNVKGYRSLPDGKFHLVLFDQDSGWNSNTALSSLEGNRSNELLCIYNNIKQNPQWRRSFVDAFCLADGSVFTSDLCALVGDSICNLVSKALSYEGRNPQSTYQRIRNAVRSETRRRERMKDLRKNYGLGNGMSVSLAGNVPQVSFRVNGQPVPFGKFNGTLFAPVSIEASAPAGYNFTGWRLGGEGGEIISSCRVLELREDKDMVLEAVFAPLKASALNDAGSHPVVVNEVSARNSIYQNDLYKRADWVELYNTTAQDIDLTGMYLSNSLANPFQATITPDAMESNTIIPAHGHKIIWMDKANGHTQLHAPFKLKDEDGGVVILTAADRSWSDTLRYDTHSGDQSVGRYPDGGKRVFRMQRPTIGAANWLSASAEWIYGKDTNYDDSHYPTSVTSPRVPESSPIIRTEYFTTDGIRLASPQQGLNIIRHTHQDGTVNVSKVMIRDRGR